MNSGSFVNHSQLADEKLDKVQRFRKLVRRPEGYLAGLETPLGHVYSVILEELSRQGKDATPDPDGFLDFIKSSVAYYSNISQARRTNLMTPSYYPTYTQHVMDYIKSLGLDYETCVKIMEDIMGSCPYDENAFDSLDPIDPEKLARGRKALTPLK